MLVRLVKSSQLGGSQSSGGERYYSPEIPGANGQGRTKEEARKSLADAIALILADRRENGLRRVPGCGAGDGDREVKRHRLLRHLRRHGCNLREKAGRIRFGSTLPPALLSDPPPYGNRE